MANYPIIIDRNKDIVEGISRLSKKDIMLVLLRKELYVGSWDKMEQDLNDKLKGLYIYKVTPNIEADLVRIGNLKKLEASLGINLLTYASALEERI